MKPTGAIRVSDITPIISNWHSDQGNLGFICAAHFSAFRGTWNFLGLPLRRMILVHGAPCTFSQAISPSPTSLMLLALRLVHCRRLAGIVVWFLFFCFLHRYSMFSVVCRTTICKCYVSAMPAVA